MAVLRKDQVPIGVPVDNTSAYLLDDNMEPVGEGALGSLYITGSNLGDGYVGAKQGSFMVNHIFTRNSGGKGTGQSSGYSSGTGSSSSGGGSVSLKILFGSL